MKLLLCHRVRASMLAVLVGFLVGSDPCSVELVSSMRSVRPGKAIAVGVRLRMAPGWHTYWRNPGDSGSATTLQWELPEGWKAGETSWPVPKVLTDRNGMVSFAYEEEAVLLTTVTPSKFARTGKFEFGVTANWVACKTECIAGSSRSTFSLEVSDGETVADPGVKTIKAALNRLPKFLPEGVGRAVQGLKEIRVTLDVGKTDATLRFLPEDPLFDHSQLTFTREEEKAVLRLHVLQSGATLKRLRGLILASKPGVWGGDSTAKVINLPVSSS